MFFVHTVTCTTNGLGETMTHPVVLYQNPDGHHWTKFLEARSFSCFRMAYNQQSSRKHQSKRTKQPVVEDIIVNKNFLFWEPGFGSSFDILV